MDPVKEKLNLLKKIANEKKTNHLISNNANNNNNNEIGDMPDNIKKPTDLKLSNKHHQEENDVKLANDEADSFINFKKEEEEFPIEENPGPLIVFDDTEKIASSESNMDIKMFSMIPEVNSNYRLNNSTNTQSNVKSQLQVNKSFTVSQQPEPTSKYINRIRDLYDKERASSTESIYHLKLRNQLQRQKLNDKILTPQNSVQSDILDRSEKSAPLASPEIMLEQSINETDPEEPSIISSINGSAGPSSNSSNHRSKSYIAHLRNTFNSHSLRSDSIEIAKRNSFIPPQESSNQIEKIKEKFTKVHDQRNSMILPTEMNKFSSHYKSLKSLKSEDFALESTQVEKFVKNLNEEAYKKSETPIQVTRKPVQKYKKSMTSDLSSYILEREKEIEARKSAEKKILDLDREIINKYSTDMKYSAENAIIKSSLNKETTRNEHSPNLSSETSNLQIKSSPITPIIKRTKSILKSPSTFSEKTIQFDDKIDIIPIDRMSDNNSPIPFDENPSYEHHRLNEDPSEFSNYSHFRPTIKKSHELEFLRKNYENYDNVPIEYLHELSPFRKNSSKIRDRIFVKSPTPMREIFDQNPPSNEVTSSSFKYLSVNPNSEEYSNNRNRFTKRTNSAAFRSQSADLSKFVDSSLHKNNNYTIDNSLLPRDRPVTKLAPANVRPNLIRQNALAKSLTKSLCDGMDKVHLSQNNEIKHRKKNRSSRKKYRKNKRSSSLTSSSSSEINSSELSESDTTTSFSSSSSYEMQFEPKDRIPRPKNYDKNKKAINKNNNSNIGEKNNKKLTRYSFYSSDDSVCGIPKSNLKLSQKSTRLCTSSKQFHKSMDDLNYERNLAEPSNNSSKKSKNLKNTTVEKKPKEKPTSHISEDMRAKNLAFIPANNIELINQLTSSRHSLLIKDENLESKRMSNGSMKSESSVNLLNSQNRKPLPSYSEVIQSKYNQNDANKNRNSVVFNYQQYSSQLLNNQGNNMNLNSTEYKNQRTSQVNQPILSSQPVNLIKQQSQQMPNNQQHLSKINQFNNDINVQQSRSKSLDPSLYIDSNQINSENQNFNEDHLIMPYQSAAIQERLKQFEQQNSINNNDIYIKQKKHFPSVESRADVLNIARKGSPFENQNKENSPFSSNMQLASNINMTNNQRQNLYQPVKNDPESNILYTTKNNLTNLNSTKSASNISLIKISNVPKQTYNPNLIAATAAAAAAIEQQNKTENLSRVFQSFPEKREKSQEKLEVKNETMNSKASNYGQIDYSNVLKRAMTFEQKSNEQNAQKTSTPIFSDNNSSKPTSRQNSPLKSVIKNAPNANQNEDVEMSTASSTSNKENNSESNEQSNEPSKLSISEKLKLFSGSGSNTNTTNNNVQNSVTFTTLNMNQNKKTSQSTSKINFNKLQNVSTESTSLPKPTSNLASTKSFNYCDRSTVLRENINKSNNSDDNSLSNKPIESLASIKSRFESKSNQDSTVDNVVNMTHENTENVNSDSQSSQKDSKRSLSRPKLDSPKLNEQFSNENKNQHESSPVAISMTIQERMAALKKNNEEDWRKRSTSASNEEKSSTTSNLVKQQKEQIKQQLDQINLSSKSKSNIKRNVLIPFLNEMKASQKHENISDDSEDFNNNNIKKNRISQSNESLDKLMNHNQNILNEKPPRKNEDKRPSPVKQSKLTKIQSGGSDTDSMLARNTNIITKPTLNKYKPEKIELFSTDSEMDSFFKDDILLNNNAFSSHSSGTKTDDNTMNEDFDEDEFDQIVSDAKRLTQEARARPHRKTKSKGNHLKNLQNRIEIKNEYEQKHVPIIVDELTEDQQRQIKEQAALVNEITRMNRFNKN